MQTQKDFIREQILRVAQREFYELGFQKTSLRTIAKKINATTGIIYSYFKNKDDLFEEIVKPACDLVINSRLKRQNDVDMFFHDFSLNEKTLLDRDNSLFAFYVQHYKIELFILFFRAQGSKMEVFLEDFIEKKAQQYYDNIELLRERGVKIKMDVDVKFLRLPIRLALTIMEEMISSDFDDKELYEFEHKVTMVLINVWKSILEVE
ncbi:MAG: TetR/AcrR family transcriptional regulator [Bacteroidales bacterium]